MRLAMMVVALAMCGVVLAQTPATQPDRVSQDAVDAAMARLNAKRAQKPAETVPKAQTPAKKAGAPAAAQAKPRTLAAIYDSIPKDLKPESGQAPTATARRELSKWFMDNFRDLPLVCDGWVATAEEQDGGVAVAVFGGVTAADGVNIRLGCNGVVTDAGAKPALLALKRGEQVRITGSIVIISISWGQRPVIEARVNQCQVTKAK